MGASHQSVARRLHRVHRRSRLRHPAHRAQHGPGPGPQQDRAHRAGIHHPLHPHRPGTAGHLPLRRSGKRPPDGQRQHLGSRRPQRLHPRSQRRSRQGLHPRPARRQHQPQRRRQVAQRLHRPARRQGADHLRGRRRDPGRGHQADRPAVGGPQEGAAPLHRLHQQRAGCERRLVRGHPPQGRRRHRPDRVLRRAVRLG